MIIAGTAIINPYIKVYQGRREKHLPKYRAGWAEGNNVRLTVRLPSDNQIKQRQAVSLAIEKTRGIRIMKPAL